MGSALRCARTPAGIDGSFPWLITETPTLSRLKTLGWTAEHNAALADLNACRDKPFLVGARVSEAHRSTYRVLTDAGDATAIATGGLHHNATSGIDRRVVGNWVAIDPGIGSGGVIAHAILPRYGVLARKQQGGAHKRNRLPPTSTPF